MNAEDTRSDEDLVSAFQKGEEKAFEILFKRYYPKVYRLALGLARHHHDAEDISQNVFLAVYIALRRFQPSVENACEHWIKRIASRAAINFIRRRDRLTWVPLSETDEEGEEHQIEIPDTGPPHVAKVEGNEIEAEIRQAIDRLPPKQRHVVRLRLFDDLSLEEIAIKIGRKVGTVKAHLYNGLAELRKILSERGFNPGMRKEGIPDEKGNFRF